MDAVINSIIDINIAFICLLTSYFFAKKIFYHEKINALKLDLEKDLTFIWSFFELDNIHSENKKEITFDYPREKYDEAISLLSDVREKSIWSNEIEVDNREILIVCSQALSMLTAFNDGDLKNRIVNREYKKIKIELESFQKRANDIFLGLSLLKKEGGIYNFIENYNINSKKVGEIIKKLLKLENIEKHETIDKKNLLILSIIFFESIVGIAIPIMFQYHIEEELPLNKSYVFTVVAMSMAPYLTFILYYICSYIPRKKTHK